MMVGLAPHRGRLPDWEVDLHWLHTEWVQEMRHWLSFKWHAGIKLLIDLLGIVHV